MTEKRFINDVSEILDTWFGYMGNKAPDEREIREKDYLLIGVARSQKDAESICEKLNEQNEELIEYCNFSLHDLLDKKNKENEQLKQTLRTYRKLVNCRNCDFHYYDCREDGDYFEICEKGKDMENGICEEWRDL